jgi:hypothetical protein
MLTYAQPVPGAGPSPATARRKACRQPGWCVLVSIATRAKSCGRRGAGCSSSRTAPAWRRGHTVRDAAVCPVARCFGFFTIADAVMRKGVS